MAINPETTTTVKVSELASAGFNTTDLVPHEVGGYLKKGTLQDLATFIGGIISTEGSVAFKAVHITDGQTLPATTSEEFILVGPGTYPNVGGGSPITTTEPLSALVSNGTYWYIGVEIPITASGTWGAIAGELSDQTDLQNALDLKADLVGGKVPSSQLPSYVDDVVEVANYAALPATGETGKIYITLDTNKVYRWSGSAYIEIAANSAVWGSITGTLSSQTDLNSALDLKVPYTGATGNVDLGSHKLTASDLVVNHTSGSGTAATISKGGNGEALTVTKSSGSGNVASFAGGVTSISELHLTTDLADDYIASASTWNAKANASNVVDLSSNQVIQGLKEFNVVRPVLGMNLSLRISDISTSGEDNGMLRMIDNTTFNELFIVESDGRVFGKSFIKKDGTSSQFLMADGSVSTGVLGGAWGSITGTLSSQTDLQNALNLKANDNAVVKLTGDQTITSGIKTFASYIIADAFVKAGGTNTQYLMADGSVSTGGTIQGGGTTNYIPRWLNSNTLGDSIIYSNVTKIGIGSQITNFATHNGQLMLKSGNTTTGPQSVVGIEIMQADVNAGYGMKIYTNSETDQCGIATRHNSATWTERLSIKTATGNVGIGTTSPLQKLHVEGLSYFGSDIFTYANGGIFFNGNNNYASGIYQNASGLNLQLGSTPKIFIANGGNVGIGTTSPTEIGGYTALTINNNSSGSFIDLNNSSTNNFRLLSLPGGDVRLISSSQLRFDTNGTERMRITSGGNVGINTQNPFSQGSGATTMELAGNTYGQFFVSANSAAARGAVMARASTFNDVYIASITNSPLIFGTNDAERMRITSGGNMEVQAGMLWLKGLTGVNSNVNGIGIWGGDNGGGIYPRGTNGAGSFVIGNTQGNITLTTSGNVTCSGTVTASGGFFNSDMRLKDLTDYDYNVSDIKPISYFWKDGRDSKKHVGYSAQEVQKVMPDAVNEGTDGMLSVNYVEVLVAKIAQMEKEIELLKSK